MPNISLNNVQSQSFKTIIDRIVDQFKVQISVYKLYQGIQQTNIDSISKSNNAEEIRNNYVNTMFNTSTPLTSFELIITEIPEISHSQDWRRFLEGSETFTELYSLISIISLTGKEGEKWTSLIQRLHQRFFSPKYSTGMDTSSEQINIKQFYDSRLFNLTDIKNNIITILTYLQYTTLNSSTTVSKTPKFDTNQISTKESQKKLLTTQLNIIDNALHGMSNIPIEGFLKLENVILEKFLVNTKQLSIDNYIFTVDIPILSYKSPFLVLKNISYTFDEVVYDNQVHKYIPKSVELQMSFDPFMPRYITRNKNRSNVTYNNRFYIEI